MRVYPQPLRRLALVLGCLLVSLTTLVQAQQIPSFLWAKSGGGTGYEAGHQIELDAAGNIYTAGVFSGISSFGTSTLTSRGDNDVYLAKYDSQGRFLWVRQLGGISYETVRGLSVDATGNACITGDFNAPFNVRNQAATITIGTNTLTGGTFGEMYLAKYDSQGNALWARQTFSTGATGNTGTSTGHSLAVDNGGNVYVTGRMAGVTQFDNIGVNSTNGSSIFIAKYNAQGIVQWVKNNPGLTTGDLIKNIAINSRGEIYLSGKYVVSVTLGNTTLPTPAVNDADLYLAKFDAQGNPIWVKPFVGVGAENCNGLTLDPADNIVLAVSFHKTISHANQTFTVQGPSTTSNSDVLVLKYNPAGDLLWSKQLGGASTSGPNSHGDSDTITGLDTDSQGNIYVAAVLIGMPTLTTSDGTDTFHYHFICYSPTGAVRWTRPTATSSYSSAIAVTPCGEILSTGYIEYSRPFDQIKLTSLGSLDYYIAKLGASTLISSTANCSPIFTDGGPSGPNKLITPNIITPNGDNQNETFRLPGLPAGPWQLDVYNRWGTRVYHTDDYRQDWDGSGLPAGQYYYYLQAPNMSAIKGWLEIIH